MAKINNVAVIGAGPAGLAAADLLAQNNIDVVVLEARDRIGGRVLTVNDAAGDVPVELGAEFIRTSHATTLKLLQETGEHAIDSTSQVFEYYNGRLRDASEIRSQLQTILQRVDVRGPDVSVREHLNSRAGADVSAEEREQALSLIEGYDAVYSADASAQAIARELSSASNMQCRASDGYGPLMQHLARFIGDRLKLQAVVDEITWHDFDVRIHGAQFGEEFDMQVDAVVITVPIAVLREYIRFNPPLPQEKRDAAEHVGMAPVVKLSMQFKTPFWERSADGAYHDAAFFEAPGQAFPTFWTMVPQRSNVLSAWAGGDAARNLRDKELQECISLALDELEQIFPDCDARSELVNVLHHNWQADPYARGAYSYLRVGADEAADVLRRPVADTLYFAGEAMAMDGKGGTVAGALESGYTAARAVRDKRSALRGVIAR